MLPISRTTTAEVRRARLHLPRGSGVVWLRRSRAFIGTPFVGVEAPERTKFASPSRSLTLSCTIFNDEGVIIKAQAQSRRQRSGRQRSIRESRPRRRQGIGFGIAPSAVPLPKSELAPATMRRTRRPLTAIRRYGRLGGSRTGEARDLSSFRGQSGRPLGRSSCFWASALHFTEQISAAQRRSLSAGTSRVQRGLPRRVAGAPSVDVADRSATIARSGARIPASGPLRMRSSTR